MEQQASYYTRNNQLNRYLEQLREEMHRARRELLEKEAHLAFIKETANGLQKAYQDIQAVYNLSRNIVRVRRPREIIKELIQAIDTVLPIEAAAFLLYDENTDQFSIILDYHLSDPLREYVRKHMNHAYHQWALHENRPIVLPDTVELGRNASSETSVILIPVVQGNKTIGLVDAFARKTPEQFSQRDFDLMIILASFAAIAIENAQLYETMELKSEAMTNMKNYLSNVLECMSNGILATDSSGRIQLINRVAQELLSLKEIDPVGNNLLDVLPDQVGARLYELARKALNSDKRVKEEIDVPAARGRKIPVGVQCNRLLDDANQVTGVIFALQDLSETYELLKLRKVDKLKDQLISNISHELRTPLSAIKSFSEILLNYDEDDENTRREFLTIINNESDRLTRLINNILDLSKLESGTAQWALEPLDMRTVIDTAVDAVQSLLVKQKLTVVKEVPDQVPVVFGDRDKLTQVMVNLLSNAIKFSPEGGKITVTLQTVNKGRNTQKWLRVGVHDQGPGIPKKHLKTIFEKFGQVLNPDDGNKPAGTGLGLTISREIVSHLGGRIWAESTKGKGASFYFELPVIPENAEDVERTFTRDPVTVVQEHIQARKSEGSNAPIKMADEVSEGDQP